MEMTLATRTQGNAWSRRMRLYWKALMLRGEAYQEVLDSPSPRKEGFRLLVVLFLTTGVVVSVGLALHWMTLPRMDVLEAAVNDLVYDSRVYQAFVEAAPAGGTLFNLLYQLFWFVLTLELGYPTARDILLGPLSMLALGLFRWVTFAVFGEWVARKFGGAARPHAFWAALALAAAPALLHMLTLVPGLYVPGGLMAAWLALTSYQAVRATYPTLSWRKCLAVEVWMFALHFICIALAVVLGVVLGVVLYQILF
jgi:hypothetical protein